MKKEMKQILKDAYLGWKNPKYGPKKWDGKEEFTKEKMYAARKWEYGGCCNMKPFKRYLKSNVGRQWDDVYSEICQVLNDKDSDYCRKFSEWMVTQEGAEHRYPCEFYVDNDGTLCESKKDKRWRQKDRQPNPSKVEIDGIKYNLIDGIWYQVETGQTIIKVGGCIYRIPCVKKRQISGKELKNVRNVYACNMQAV
jgi:hypothetical protein